MDTKKTDILQQISYATRLFKAISGIEVSVVLNNKEKSPACKCCRLAKNTGTFNISCSGDSMCNKKQSALNGKKSIFICQCGFLHFAVPIIYKTELIAVAVSAPIALSLSKERAVKDFLKQFNMPASVDSALLEQLLSLSDVKPEKISASADMLSMIVSGIDGTHKYNWFGETEKELVSAIDDSDRDSICAVSHQAIDKIIAENSKNTIKNLCIEFVFMQSRMAAECAGGTTFGERVINCILKLSKCSKPEEMRIYMLEIIDAFADALLADSVGKHNEIIRGATEYISNNYMNKITLESVAAHVYLSPSYLSRIFKEETGQNFNGYLNSVRVSHAKQLILEGNTDLVAVGAAVGYDDRSYFSKVFKRITGVTPNGFKTANLKKSKPAL